MTEYEICDVSELDDGERLLVQLEGRDICVFNVDGEFRAYTNWCPHQAGPACEGPLSGTLEATYNDERFEVDFEWIREGEILACPWHGWEFDVLDGQCVSKADAKLPKRPVRVEDGSVFVSL